MGVDSLSNPSFGSLIVASHNDFYWSEKHKAFIRISEAWPYENTRYLVEVVNWIDLPFIARNNKPSSDLIIYKPRNKAELDQVLEKCIPLQDIREPKEYIKFIVNIDGIGASYDNKSGI